MKKGAKLISLFLISIFFISLAIVNAQQTNEIVSRISEIISNFFGGVVNYDYLGNILSPQILLGILVFLVIFSILNQISLFKSNKWILGILSVVISILAAGFISTEWIMPIINQYTAIGIAISFLIPFVLLFYFLKEIAPHNTMIQKFIWIVYFVIVILNALLNWGKIPAGAEGNFTRFLYIAIIALAFVMMVASNKILGWIFKEQLEGAFEKYEDIQKLINAGKKADAQAALYSVGSQLPASRRNQLQEQIKKM